MKQHWTTFAKGKAKRPGKMNATEAAYAELLRVRQAAEEVEWFEYEGLSFRIGEGARYCPDFVVMLADGLIELHEVKGFWAEAAKVRIRAASKQYPFRFVAVKKKKGGGWEEEDF